MAGDKRPPLRASELPAGQVRLYPGEPPAIACPGCGRWMVPRGGRLRAHPRHLWPGTWPASDRCPASGLGVWLDLTPAQWLAELDVAVRDAASRGNGWAHRRAARASGRRYAGHSGRPTAP